MGVKFNETDLDIDRKRWQDESICSLTDWSITSSLTGLVRKPFEKEFDEDEQENATLQVC